MSTPPRIWIVTTETVVTPTRLDRWLAGQDAEVSRARWQELIRSGAVTVNGRACRPNQAVRPGDCIEAVIPPPAPVEVAAEAIPLSVVYEDESLIVIDKPPGMVVHPAPGHAGGTLVNALLHHVRDLKGIGNELRPGIVHRLDRDTSGLLVAAKDERTMVRLARQFKSREVGKEYLALAWGRPRPPQGTVRTTIGRDPRNRKKMSTRSPRGREAVTHYETVETFSTCSLLRVRIETGRTHQIRVHLAHLGHPVVGDAVYGRGGKPRLPVPAERQMLHAAQLRFTHPATGLPLDLASPLPPDFEAVVSALRQHP